MMKFPKAATYDNMFTPVDGEDSIQIKQAAVDSEKLRTLLGATIEEAQANDPSVLKKRIAELERALLKSKPLPATVSSEKMEECYWHGFKEATQQFSRDWRNRFERLNLELMDSINELEAQLFRAEIDKTQRDIALRILSIPSPVGEGVSLKTASHPMSKSPPTRHRFSTVSLETVEIDVPLRSLQEKILNALRWMHDKGIDHPSRQMTAAIAGVKSTGGYFANTVSSLKTQDLISYPASNCLALTATGASYADPIVVEGDIPDQWRCILSGLEVQLFDVLLTNYPTPLSREGLALQVGKKHNTGYFANTVSRLRTLGVINYPSKNFICLTEHVMPEAQA